MDGAQICFWTMFVKPELAAQLKGRAHTQLPEQGVFQALRVKSSELRSLLFDPQVATDIVTDITRVYPLIRGDATSTSPVWCVAKRRPTSASRSSKSKWLKRYTAISRLADRSSTARR